MRLPSLCAHLAIWAVLAFPIYLVAWALLHASNAVNRAAAVVARAMLSLYPDEDNH